MIFERIVDFLTQGALNLNGFVLLLILLIFTQLTIFAVTLYLHRSQTHRSVEFHPIISHFFRFWSWLTTSMITREWVAIHRKHHAKVETPDDPHSPQVEGIRTVFLQGAELYRKARQDREEIERYGKGTPDDWIERHLYTPHANWGPALLFFLELGLFGLPGVAMWAVQMMWIPFWAAGVVNGFGHYWGYRNFESDDTSTNLIPWGVWIGGEELHNNHHAFPRSAKFSMRRWEFDMGWLVIRVLSKVGLAKVLWTAPQLDVRPNIAVPDLETLKALLAHRSQAMTEFQRSVLMPMLREDARQCGVHLRKWAPRFIRKNLVSGGHWLSPALREQMNGWISQRPRIQLLMTYHQRLIALLDARNEQLAERVEQLRAWCREAEASGMAALRVYSMRMKSYASARAG